MVVTGFFVLCFNLICYEFSLSEAIAYHSFMFLVFNCVVYGI